MLFSDTAYQALPPGTPVAELRRFERFFVVPRRERRAPARSRRASPWTDTFSAGTRISTGLALALRRSASSTCSRPVVLLVSDLDDDAGDLERLTSVALAYRKLGIPIRVVGLNPSPEDVRLVERLLPQRRHVVRSRRCRASGAAASSLAGPRPRASPPRSRWRSRSPLFLALTERLRWSRA